MGYYCVFNQMPERVLMHIEESEIGELFRRIGDPSNRRTSLPVLLQYEQAAMVGQPPPSISLEKMWGQLHHLLTGEPHPSASPLSRSIYGGRPFKIDVGDGPARYIWADEVREISSALSALSHEDLHRRFAPASLKADPPFWPFDMESESQELLGELKGYFDLLQTYYRIAASRGNAMLIGVV